MTRRLEDVMSCGTRPASGPFGLEASKGGTCRYRRTVLAVVHHLTSATRLADLVPMLEADRRIQVVYTWAPGSVFSGGVPEYLQGLGAVVVPWCQAVQSRFDLAVAASYGSLEQVHAPVLTVPHGVGFGKLTSRWDGHGPVAARAGAGAVPARLVYHGRVVPSAIIVATQAHLAHLTRACPEAAQVAVLAGDPCFDRLAASLPHRASYRVALGAENRRVVVVSSTWGPGSLLRRHPELLAQLAEELRPEDYQIAAILHPNTWAWHGRRQVLAWYSDCLRRGVLLVPPEEGWRGLLAAADAVVGDHGSVTCYATAAGVPVLLASFPRGEIEPGSPPAMLGRIAGRLCPGRPLGPQLDHAAASWPDPRRAEAAAQVTSVPGQASRIIRATMYRLLKLPEPEAPPPIPAVPAPAGISFGEVQW
jgi:hypothetical protein